MLKKLVSGKEDVAHAVSVSPHGVSISVEPGEVLLDALLRNEVDVPYSCQAGSCGECKCRLINGKVKELLDSAYALERKEIEAGYVLACQSTLKSDVEIAYPNE